MGNDNSSNRACREGNLFTRLPQDQSREHFQRLNPQGAVCIERIVSFGQGSPADGWYDQEQEEWVLLLQGRACIAFAGERGEVTLAAGDFLHIAAHERHRVLWTDPEHPTLWLAVHYPGPEAL